MFFSNCVGVCSALLNLICDTLLQHIYSLEDEVMRRVDVYFGSEFFKLRLEVIRVYMDSPYFVPMCRIHTLNIDACVDFDCACHNALLWLCCSRNWMKSQRKV